MELENLSLAEIVTAQPMAAQVLEDFNLDYCCGGKRKLSESLNDDAKLKEVTASLEKIFATNIKEIDFNKLPLTQLVDYIIEKHHGYVKKNLPVIQRHIEKVVTKHGKIYPEMKKVKTYFNEITRDFEQHMFKEETILFPRIKKTEEAFNTGNPAIENIQAPIQVMEHEHDVAHMLMEEIKNVTNNYSSPLNTCTTFRVCLEELKIFEKDLHQHVHLENNILFPKALELQNNLNN